jgi:putative transcriptional regulator
MKNRLRVLRAERDWTQAGLAERLSVSRQTVNAVETEKYEPSLSLAFKIARLFSMRIEEIFEADGTNGSEEADGSIHKS